MSFKDDYVIGMLVVKREGQVLVVSSKGFGKRSLLEQYREQQRGGKGVFTLKANDKTGKLISILEVVENDDLMIITDGGIMIRQSINKLNIIGRNTQGVKLLKLGEDSQIASVTKVIKEDDEGEEKEELKNPERNLLKKAKINKSMDKKARPLINIAALEKVRKTIKTEANSKIIPKIIAVTKTRPIEAVRAALKENLFIIGENQVQEAEQKFLKNTKIRESRIASYWQPSIKQSKKSYQFV